MRKLLITFAPGLIGGAVGAYCGYLAVWFIMSNLPFWVPILPGAFAGLACGQLSSVKSSTRGVVNGLICLVITIYAQFKLFNPPFDFDGGFGDYVAHLPQLPPLTLVLIVVNGLIAAWWGREARIGTSRIKPTSAAEV